MALAKQVGQDLALTKLQLVAEVTTNDLGSLIGHLEKLGGNVIQGRENAQQ